MKFLPRAWAAAERHNILRSRILVTLYQLVYSLRAKSVGLHGMLLPLIRQCCTPSQDPTQNLFYLLDPALELWSMVVQQSPILSRDLLQLFEVWIYLFRTGNMECFDLRMQILESYMVLSHPSATLQGSQPPPTNDPPAQTDLFMNQYAKPVAEFLNQKMYDDLSDDALSMVLRCLETMAQLHPGPFVRMFGAQALGKGVLVLIQEDLLDQAAVRRAEEEADSGRVQSLGDRIRAQRERPPRLEVPSEILNSYSCLLSRVALHSGNDFKQTVLLATQQLLTAQEQQPFHPQLLQQRQQRDQKKPYFEIGEPEFPSYVAFLIRQELARIHPNQPPPSLSPNLVLGFLIDAWAERIDNMSQPYRRKLNALALCNLLPNKDPFILQRVPTIVNVVSGVVLELEEDTVGYSPYYRQAQARPLNERTEEDRVILVRLLFSPEFFSLSSCARVLLRFLLSLLGNPWVDCFPSPLFPSYFF